MAVEKGRGVKFISLFDGIYGFGLGFERAGMECVGRSEIDQHCNVLMDKRRPNIPNYGDVRNVTKENTPPADIICGGFPCQDISVAGKRAGLAGERSGMWYEYARIIEELRPRWVVIENVPGLLSSNRGRDMGAIIGTLAEFGYGWAYRRLDAQYFGLAQRRKRMFIIGCLTPGRAAQVLFEPESGAWDPPPSREKGEGIAGTIGARTCRSVGAQDAMNNHMLYSIMPMNSGKDYKARQVEVTQPIVISGNHHGNQGGDYVVSVNARQDPIISIDQAQTLDGLGNCQAVALLSRPGMKQQNYIAWHKNQGVGVRRLTPTECERLQGFPDGWTAGGQSDTQRYKQLGNAVAVPVAEWIGRRIMEYA